MTAATITARPDTARTGPCVSIVVPVKSDAMALTALLAQLPPQADAEIIVSATGPVTAPMTATRDRRPDVQWIDGPPGRGVQLNAGAALASGRWLWFVHADSVVPVAWAEVFAALDAQTSVVAGAFAFRLCPRPWQARWLEQAVAWRVRLFGLPYGDQGLFVRRDVFAAMGGFAPIPLMEDVEFVRRVQRRGAFVARPEPLTTSARRWVERGWLRQSTANLVTLSLYFLGASPARLAIRYERRAEGRQR